MYCIVSRIFYIIISVLACLLIQLHYFLVFITLLFGATNSSTGGWKCGIKKASMIVGGTETDVRNMKIKMKRLFQISEEINTL